MRIKGLLLVFLVAVVIVFAMMTIKVGDKTPLKTEVDQFVQAGADLTKATMQTLQKIIQSYIATEGQPPASLQDLRTSNLLTGAVLDAWGQAIRYERKSEAVFRLVSAGRDKVFDTADDIVIED